MSNNIKQMVLSDYNVTGKLDVSAISVALEKNGYTRVEQFLSTQEAERLQVLYDFFLDGTIQTRHLRSDLSGDSNRGSDKVENITQIMWPSHLVPVLLDLPVYQRAWQLARAVMGDDMAIDFDMLINKAPGTDTETPWHQDAAYWPELPDSRSMSFWIALDEAEIDNGCMWYIPGSHKEPMRPHRQIGSGGALKCDASEDEGEPVELSVGGATIHSGYTLHYTRGNCTDRPRRALIINFRPQSMIQLEREKGFDHGLAVNKRQMRNTKDHK
jgi:phytanoyl-CoA hydroxylase